jgi:hypothetical protein
MTEGMEFESRYGQELSLLHIVKTGSRVHPISYPMNTEGSFPEADADHSPPTSVEVSTTWIYTSTPHTSSWLSA